LWFFKKILRSIRKNNLLGPPTECGVEIIITTIFLITNVQIQRNSKLSTADVLKGNCYDIKE